jgi:hypothetical protein
MTRRLMAAGPLLLAVAVLVTAAGCAQKTSRLRVVEGGIRAPRLMTRVEPDYPQQAKLKRIQGTASPSKWSFLSRSTSP